MGQHEAHVAAIGTAVPYPISTVRYLEKDTQIRRQLDQPEKIIKRAQAFIEGTGIRTRHLSHPMWLPVGETPTDHPAAVGVALSQDRFTADNFTPPHWQRMQFFEDTTVKLAIRAAEKALEQWHGDPGQISHIITTCTSGWSEPGVAVSVIRALGLSDDTQKAELNFNGCFCGATCLRLARDIIRAGDATGVLVVAVETASNHYDPKATDLSSLVAHALFADGAAAVILTPDQGAWKYTATGMSLVPDSEKLLQFHPPLDPEHSSYRMYLDRHVGDRLGDYFGRGAGSALMKKLSSGPGRAMPGLGVHPGGPNILDSVGASLRDMGWPADALQTSYDTLHSFGNLGAAAMLFVLERRLKAIDEDELITLAFGPGVTVEWARLERA